MVTSVHKWFIAPLLAFCFLGFNGGSSKTELPDAGRHPFHVSVTEIKHNSTDKILEITCKIFTDDFEAVLARNYKTKVDLVHPQDKAAMDKLVSDYIRHKLQVKTDGKLTVLNYVGYEVDHEAVNAYLEVDKVLAVKKIEVSDILLYDLYNDQIGIIHVIVNGNRKSTKLDYPNSQAAFSF
jgi:hypothetical protein